MRGFCSWKIKQKSPPPSHKELGLSNLYAGDPFNSLCGYSLCAFFRPLYFSKVASKQDLGGRFGYLLFIFSVWGRGKGRKRPSRWWGAFFFFNRGRGGLGGGQQLPRECLQGGGGAKYFFRGWDAHQEMLQVGFCTRDPVGQSRMSH